jgi:signal transduction histidine kinase
MRFWQGAKWSRGRVAGRRGKSGEPDEVVAARVGVSFARSVVSDHHTVPEPIAEVIDLSPIDQFRGLVAALPDGIVVVDKDGKVRLVNPAAETLLGRPGRDLVGRAFDIPSESSAEREVRVTRPDGSEVVLEVRGEPLEWDGNPCVVASLRDVTARNGSDAHQSETIERLQELDRLRTDFVGIVSHDLRSPMATIAGFVDTLRSNWSRFDDDQKMRMLDRISRSTDQLARLVENVLHVSQIESGKLNYRIKEVDLGELIRRVADENAGDTDRIEIRIEEDLPPARADDIRQWQVLSNLVTNALKFSEPDQPVEIAACRNGAHLEVSVHDRGIGIKPEDKDRLFDKFTRLEQPEDLNVKGSGLGLYICKAMVEGQGGTISVDSEPGRGATFTYTVPAAL